MDEKSNPKIKVSFILVTLFFAFLLFPLRNINIDFSKNNNINSNSNSNFVNYKDDNKFTPVDWNKVRGVSYHNEAENYLYVEIYWDSNTNSTITQIAIDEEQFVLSEENYIIEESKYIYYIDLNFYTEINKNLNIIDVWYTDSYDNSVSKSKIIAEVGHDFVRGSNSNYSIEFIVGETMNLVVTTKLESVDSEFIGIGTINNYYDISESTYDGVKYYFELNYSDLDYSKNMTDLYIYQTSDYIGSEEKLKFNNEIENPSIGPETIFTLNNISDTVYDDKFDSVITFDLREISKSNTNLISLEIANVVYDLSKLGSSNNITISLDKDKINLNKNFEHDVYKVNLSYLDNNGNYKNQIINTRLDTNFDIASEDSYAFKFFINEFDNSTDILVKTNLEGYNSQFEGIVVNDQYYELKQENIINDNTYIFNVPWNDLNKSSLYSDLKIRQTINEEGETEDVDYYKSIRNPIFNESENYEIINYGIYNEELQLVIEEVIPTNYDLIRVDIKDYSLQITEPSETKQYILSIPLINIYPDGIIDSDIYGITLHTSITNNELNTKTESIDQHINIYFDMATEKDYEVETMWFENYFIVSVMDNTKKNNKDSEFQGIYINDYFYSIGEFSSIGNLYTLVIDNKDLVKMKDVNISILHTSDFSSYTSSETSPVASTTNPNNANNSEQVWIISLSTIGIIVIAVIVMTAITMKNKNNKNEYIDLYN